MAQVDFINHQRHPGVPGETFNEEITDSIYSVPFNKFKLGDQQAIGAFIMVSGDDGRMSFGADPVQGGLGYPLPDGDEVALSSFEQVKDFKIINDTAATALTLTITIFYR